MFCSSSASLSRVPVIARITGLAGDSPTKEVLDSGPSRATTSVFGTPHEIAVFFR